MDTLMNETIVSKQGFSELIEHEAEDLKNKEIPPQHGNRKWPSKNKGGDNA